MTEASRLRPPPLEANAGTALGNRRLLPVPSQQQACKDGDLWEARRVAIILEEILIERMLASK